MNSKRIKKNINQNHYLADQLVATPYGSLLRSYEILNGIKYDDAKFISKMKKAQFPFMDDPEFLAKTLIEFGYDIDNLKGKPLALIEGEYNTLFCPYLINKKNGEVLLLPLFEDRHFLHTQEWAMVEENYSFIDIKEDGTFDKIMVRNL